jgi:hypothetical protein
MWCISNLEANTSPYSFAEIKTQIALSPASVKKPVLIALSLLCFGGEGRGEGAKILQLIIFPPFYMLPYLNT